MVKHWEREATFVLPGYFVIQKGGYKDMASIEKFVDAAVVNQLRHCNREIKNDKNKDIDPDRTKWNLSLTPEREMGEYEYYKARKKELYCYGRADVKTMCGWIITAPQELGKLWKDSKTPDPEDLKRIRSFFERTAEFLIQRYGIENVISITTHFDEGKMRKVKDRWGEYVRDENGEIKKELVIGRPHLHFNFIPVVADNNPKHAQTEKICANDRINKLELKRFHSELANATDCPYVMNGKTKEQGRNYTVEEMKERYETAIELERLREIERQYIMEHERTFERNDTKKGTRW